MEDETLDLGLHFIRENLTPFLGQCRDFLKSAEETERSYRQAREQGERDPHGLALMIEQAQDARDQGGEVWRALSEGKRLYQKGNAIFNRVLKDAREYLDELKAQEDFGNGKTSQE